MLPTGPFTPSSAVELTVVSEMGPTDASRLGTWAAALLCAGALLAGCAPPEPEPQTLASVVADLTADYPLPGMDVAQAWEPLGASSPEAGRMRDEEERFKAALL
ncbi:MAG: hypothetical protein ACYS26_20725, partial [Planctomycetota bacterium]